MRRTEQRIYSCKNSVTLEEEELIWRPRSLMNIRYPLNWRLGDLHIRPSFCRQKNLGHCREFKSDSLVVQAISLPSHSTAFTVSGPSAKLQKATIHFDISICMYVRMYACMHACTSMSVHPPVLSVNPSTWNNSAPTGRIFKKFDIWMCFEDLSWKFKFH